MFNTEPLLFGQSVGHVVVEMVALGGRKGCFLAGASRNAALTLFYVDRVTPPSGHKI